jgi:hypothetical protein
MFERSLLGLGEGFFALLLCLCAVQASAQERDNRESHPSLGDKNAPLATTLPDAPSASQEPGEGKQTKRILGIIPNFRAVSVDTHLPPQTPNSSGRDTRSAAFLLRARIQAGIPLMSAKSAEPEQPPPYPIFTIPVPSEPGLRPISDGY